MERKEVIVSSLIGSYGITLQDGETIYGVIYPLLQAGDIVVSYTTFSLQVQHFPYFLSFASIEYSTLPGSSGDRVNLLIHPPI
jgi:hypothetical protein